MEGTEKKAVTMAISGSSSNAQGSIKKRRNSVTWALLVMTG